MPHTQWNRAARASILTILCVSCAAAGMAGQGADPKNKQRRAYKLQPGDFVVVCTLYKGRAPGATDATPTEPVTYDPRFEIGARIERVTLGESPWRVGDRVTFLIHSPTLTLDAGFDGRQYALTFSPFQPVTKSDRVWFEPETRYLLRWVEPAKAVKE